MRLEQRQEQRKLPLTSVQLFLYFFNKAKHFHNSFLIFHQKKQTLTNVTVCLMFCSETHSHHRGLVSDLTCGADVDCMSQLGFIGRKQHTYTFP